ncbi:MAG TPA: DUF1684 domain-containing protein [Ktedonobacterales bacterium]|jgi:uncharacterized protein (DUF1684 family)|nr:DUF1684 domain-containing protein [Ktedonobacterales bacterium]
MTQTDNNDYIVAVNEYRARKDEAFGSSPDSPINQDERDRFSGLSYFPPDPAYRVLASVVPFAEQAVVQLGSTKGDVRPQLRFAELHFTLSGQDLRLTGYQDVDPDNGNELFVPFRDATTGKETYGAGRYLEVEVEQGADGKLSATLDFNLAYSPWCAYNVAYSCTLPPVENTLPIAIQAGERTYEAHA